MESNKDKPFALIGVNSDPRKKAVESRRGNRITWRSFWDGGSTEGPIASRWHVQGWPTLYILDPEGVIRFKSIGPMDKLEEKIDQLLADVKSTNKNQVTPDQDRGDPE